MKLPQSIPNWLITALLAITVVLMALLNNEQYKEKRKALVKTNNELVEQLDTLQSKIADSRRQTDSLFLLVDSLDRRDSIHVGIIADLTKALKKIPHRYDKVPQDSLGLIMDERAANKH